MSLINVTRFLHIENNNVSLWTPYQLWRLKRFCHNSNSSLMGKCYFDTVFSLTSVWPSDMSCVVSRGNKREISIVFGLCGLPLSFCKGVFCHLPYENAGQFEREKHISFLIAFITPRALKERTEKNSKIRICPPLHSFPAANPPSLWCFLLCCRSSSVCIGGIDPKQKVFLVWNKLAMCRCLLRLGFRVCSYHLVLLASYACMRKMVSCCVLGCWCRCLLRLWFRVCSYDLLLLDGYACMRKMVSCCVLGCWCQTLLRLGSRVCSHGLLLLSGYACKWKKWFLDVFWVTGVKLCFVYGLGFVHMVYSCLLVMHVREKNGFLLCSGLLVSIFHPPMSSFYPENCVFQNYTQRTT